MSWFTPVEVSVNWMKTALVLGFLFEGLFHLLRLHRVPHSTTISVTFMP